MLTSLLLLCCPSMRAALCLLLLAAVLLDTAHGVACLGPDIKTCDCTATAITCANSSSGPFPQT